MSVHGEIAKQTESPKKSNIGNSSLPILQSNKTVDDFVPGLKNIAINNLVAGADSIDEHDSSQNYIVIGEGDSKITRKDVKEALKKTKDANNIVIHNDVKSLGTGAFYQCKNLKKVVLPEGLESIGGYAFTYCESLEEIEIPNSVKSLGEEMFLNCSNLKSINMSGVIKLSGSVFERCTNLEKIYLPNLKELSESTFMGCDKLNIEECVLPQDIKIKLKELKEKRIKTLKNKKETIYKTLKLLNILNEEDTLDSLDKKIENLDKNNASYIHTLPRKDWDPDFEKYRNTNFINTNTNKNISDTDNQNIQDFSNSYRRRYTLRSGVRCGLVPKKFYMKNGKLLDKIPDIEISKKLIKPYENNEELLLYRGVQWYDTVDYMVLGGQKIGTFKSDPQSLIGKILSDDSFTSTSMDKSIPIKYATSDPTIKRKDYF